jgi:3-oxoacyl-[acyl-carrier protein] reductase
MFNSCRAAGPRTGGSKGIGRGIAETFAAAGVDVVVRRNHGDVDAAVAPLPTSLQGERVRRRRDEPDDCRVVARRWNDTAG